MSKARMVLWRPEHLKGWQGQVCKVCGRVDVVHYQVPNELWVDVVPEELRGLVVCLRCFDAFAAQKRIDYADQLMDIGFAGMRESFGLRMVSSDYTVKRKRQGIMPWWIAMKMPSGAQGVVSSDYTVTLTELEAQIEEVARRRLGLSVAEIEARIDSGEYKLDEDNYELWSWLRGMVGSARAMRRRDGGMI